MMEKPKISVWKLGIIVLCCLLLLSVARWLWPAPEFKDGDIIFQTSRSGQSSAIILASRSLYSHMGILKKANKGWVVVEAVGPVKETPLKLWVKRGWQGRVAVYRDSDLSDKQKAQVFAAANRLYGRKYDRYFSFDNNEIYCSELVYLAFKNAGIELGRTQTIASLGTDLGFAKALLNRRAYSDPECKQKRLDHGAACLTLVRSRLLVTPKSIAEDKDVKRVYSNYPF